MQKGCTHEKIKINKKTEQHTHNRYAKIQKI